MRRISPILFVFAFGIFAGCSGELILPFRADPCTGGNCPCQSIEDCPDHYDCLNNVCVLVTCSPVYPEGLCPAGRECTNGICVPLGTGDYCNCEPEQACAEGVCYVITDDNMCSETRVTGMCPVGSVCIGGACTEITPSNACSPSVPNGLCQAGAACVDGYCLPIAESRCSTANQTGRCAAGMTCVPPGICDYLPCSADAPWGRCEIGQFCGSLFACIPIGSCATSLDCDPLYECEGDACVRDLSCVTSEECLSSEHCASNSTCMPIGTCAAGSDCEDGQFCSTLGNCIAEGTCESGDDCLESSRCLSDQTCASDTNECAFGLDCPPGHGCSDRICVQTGTTCTGNVASPDQACIDAGTCCPQGQRCAFLDGSSPPGVCIFDGLCLTDADCLTGYMTCGEDYHCEFTKSCDTCAAGEECSQAGGCVPEDNCGRDSDCGSGVCNALWECVADQGCFEVEFPATMNKPNMLIVLDQSWSMSYDFPGSENRWEAARTALTSVLNNYGNPDYAGGKNNIRFGFVAFPNNEGDSCAIGSLIYAVGDDRGTIIIEWLENHPNPKSGGYTPAGKTLRSISASPGNFGLADSTRENFVLFVTDGEPNCDGSSPASRVRGALQLLYMLPTPVRTYVIGIAASDDLSANLDTFAVFGRTELCTGLSPGTCSGNPLTCSTTGTAVGTCYYPADNLTELNEHFDAIAGQVASCTYNLGSAPPDPSLINVSLLEGSTETPLATSLWTYNNDPVNPQVHFLEPTCTDKIKSGVATPIIRYGCPQSG